MAPIGGLVGKFGPFTHDELKERLEEFLNNKDESHSAEQMKEPS